MATIINSSTSNGLVMTPDTSGEIELQANGVTKAKVTANGLQDANGASLRGGSFRNLIINGDMSIAQRSTSEAGLTSTGYHTVDRWSTLINSTGTWTQTQDTDVPTGQGFGYSLKLQCTTADASLGAADEMFIRQPIESQNLTHLAYGTSSAKTLTLSFWVKSNKTGTYIAEMQNYNATATRIVSNAITISNADTWEKKTWTFAGDTAYILYNNNAAGIRFALWLATGSNRTSGTLNTTWTTAGVDADRCAGQTVNLADSTSNYINITGVQLEVGSGASDFEFLPYDVQLARCQRYFYIADAYLGGSANYPTVGAGYNISSTEARISVQYPVMMRVKPTLSYTGTLYILNSAGTGLVVTSIASNYGNAMSGMVSFGVASGLTQGHGTLLITNNGSGQTFQASAEL